MSCFKIALIYSVVKCRTRNIKMEKNMYSLNDIKSWFKTGKFPMEDLFAKAWDSFWHKAEKMSISVTESL